MNRFKSIIIIVGKLQNNNFFVTSSFVFVFSLNQAFSPLSSSLSVYKSKQSYKFKFFLLGIGRLIFKNGSGHELSILFSSDTIFETCIP